MFKHPFSFDGRIRRTEYGITFIIFIVTYVIIMALFESQQAALSLVGFAIMIPLIWFLWAQGAKRCHDIDRSLVWCECSQVFGNTLCEALEHCVSAREDDVAV